MSVLYIGFKGNHNASHQLVRGFQGEKVFLTNSFSGVKRDIDTIHLCYDMIIMFGIDKALANSVRIEKCAVKDENLLYTGIKVSEISQRITDMGIINTVSIKPTHYLCNEAYYYMLAKSDLKAVFIHIPSSKNATDDFAQKMRFALNTPLHPDVSANRIL